MTTKRLPKFHEWLKLREETVAKLTPKEKVKRIRKFIKPDWAPISRVDL